MSGTSGRPRELMRAVVVEEFGPADVLQVREVASPVPGRRDLVVAVVAAGVNPVDAQNRLDGSWAGIETPFIPGSDASGRVVAVGEDVRDVSVGDEVFYFSDFLATRDGSYAEYQAVDERLVARKPRSLTHGEAAALPLAAGTAYELVVRRLAVTEGTRLLVIGAAGGVGAFAVQLGAARGAHVIALARSEHHEFLRTLGAAAALDYRDGDAVTRVGEVDAVVDLVGDDTLERSLTIIAPFGRAASATRLTGDFELAVDKNVTLHGVLVRPERERLQQLARLADTGALRVSIRAELPLEEAADAHRLVEHGHGRGKVILRVRDEP